MAGNTINNTYFFIFCSVLFFIGIIIVIFTSPRHNNSSGTSGTTGTRSTQAPIVNPNSGSSPNGVVLVRDNCAAFTTMQTCNRSNFREWDVANTKCDCLTPFWGPQGDREAFKNTYVDGGNPLAGDIQVGSMSLQNVNRLSFPLEGTTSTGQNLCTSLCDINTGCIGVLYNEGKTTNSIGVTNTCELLSSINVIPGHNIYYSSLIDSTLYMKGNNAPTFSDRAFLSLSSMPSRYWVLNNSNNFQVAWRAINYRLPFKPTAVVAQNLTGYYYTSPFTVNNIPSGAYIQLPGAPLNIPSDWNANSLYVLYN